MTDWKYIMSTILISIKPEYVSNILNGNKKYEFRKIACKRSIDKMIPKVIHYCWFGGNPLPPLAEKCIASWREYLPDFKIIRWDETNFDYNSHPYTKAAYKAGLYAFVSDYARFKILYY